MENAAVAGWKLSMKRSSTLQEQIRDQPNFWTTEPESLHTSANAKVIKLGSGTDIYTSIAPAIEQVQQELILVTCFWARSESSVILNAALRRLSKRAEQQDRTIRVRICCSSISLWQKLLHTRSLRGRTYHKDTWQSMFGLPPANELPNINLQIKSVFVLPFSVMHPKFIILDRQRVFLPSCNVSWENWFDGCIELTGPITGSFVTFWQSYWASEYDKSMELASSSLGEASTSSAMFLPSPHHSLSILDGLSTPVSPPTPLNLFLLSLFRHATRCVYLQTPNITSRVVLGAIVEALTRGIDVCLVTSERLMILEQIVTARTTTSRCVRWLIKQHRDIMQRHTYRSEDIELLRPKLGKLHISYYQPRLSSDPVQSHIKVSIADNRIIVLGSGNLDRASWVTSQELGVAILDETFASDFRQQLDLALQGRLKQVYSA